MLAVRPRTLPAAAAGVIMGSALAWRDGSFRLDAALACLLAALLLQIGSNLANDVFDYERGIDTPGRLGPIRVTQAGLLTPSQVKVGMAVVFALAALIGDRFDQRVPLLDAVAFEQAPHFGAGTIHNDRGLGRHGLLAFAGEALMQLHERRLGVGLRTDDDERTKLQLARRSPFWITLAENAIPLHHLFGRESESSVARALITLRGSVG